MVTPPTILPLRLSAATVRRQGRTLLGPLDLTLPPGGPTLVIGPNGSGKTTLLRLMHGIERLSSGTRTWARPEADARPAQSYVFQTPVMMRRTVLGNLIYPLRLRGTPLPQATELARDWAARINLADALDRPAPRLSGGERQKLALARALITAPEVVFLDEPCASLDGRATREFEALLTDAATTGTRIVMTTHDLGQARRLAADVIFLLHGHITEMAPATQFFDTPQTAAARAFLKGDIIE